MSQKEFEIIDDKKIFFYCFTDSIVPLTLEYTKKYQPEIYDQINMNKDMSEEILLQRTNLLQDISNKYKNEIFKLAMEHKKNNKIYFYFSRMWIKKLKKRPREYEMFYDKNLKILILKRLSDNFEITDKNEISDIYQKSIDEKLNVKLLIKTFFNSEDFNNFNDIRKYQIEYLSINPPPQGIFPKMLTSEEIKFNSF